MNAIHPHPAYPSARQLREERHHETVALADLDAADKLRAALQAAIDAIRPLEFATGWPAYGWDKASTLDLLTDMMPQEMA